MSGAARNIALYPWFKLEWKGARNNNNGRIRLSVRQAGKCIGGSPGTAARAIHDLQRKGWLVVYRKAVLGIEGQARGHEYEITELALPTALERKEDRKEGIDPRPRFLFQHWRPEKDYPVAHVPSNNPKGTNRPKKQNPVIETDTNANGHVLETDTGRVENWYEQAG